MNKLIKNSMFRFLAMVCRNDGPKVVYYHDIGTKYTNMGTVTELFQAHVATAIENGFTFVGSAEDLTEERRLQICFDDGFNGIWDERMWLASQDIHPIVFIAIDLVGKPGYLTWDKIRELQNEYGVHFQCHTWSHQTLAGPWNGEVAIPQEGRTDEWYRHELIDSKAELERQLGKKVTALCFPVGYFSDDVIRRCKAAGYEKVYASYPGNVTGGYILPRCLVQGLSESGFKCVLRGGMNLFKNRYLRMHKIG